MNEIPDIEKVISKYLRQVTDQRVVAHPPKDKGEPWTMVTMYDAPQPLRSRADHVVDFHVQLDVYAGLDGGLPEAGAHMREARARMGEMPEAQHDDCVVSAVRIYGSQRIMDTSLEPARDRYVLDMSVTAHGV